MKKHIIILTVLISITLPDFAQRWKLKRYEAIFGLGAINLLTDLGVSSAESILYGFRVDFSRPNLYGGVRYKFSQTVSGKFSLVSGIGHSHDITNTRVEGTEGFKSNTFLVEPSITAEYYFKKEEKRYRSAAVFNRRGMVNNYSLLSAYFYGGLGGVYFNSSFDFEPRPQDEIKKSGLTLVIPVGIGAKYVISDKWIFGYEIGPRLVFSDFLEGYTTNTSKHNDAYWVTSFYLAYKLKTSRRNLPLFLDRQWRRARN
jgi:hypothetical protein